MAGSPGCFLFCNRWLKTRALNWWYDSKERAKIIFNWQKRSFQPVFLLEKCHL